MSLKIIKDTTLSHVANIFFQYILQWATETNNSRLRSTVKKKKKLEPRTEWQKIDNYIHLTMKGNIE